MGMGVTTPDLHWEVKDILVTGDRVIVRGEATGTPAAEFWGAKPTGKSFKTMATTSLPCRMASSRGPIMSKTG